MNIKKISVIAIVLAVAVLSGCGDASDDPGKKNTAAYSEGLLGDTMHTYFFDYTVNSAYTCDSYESYTPAEGCQLLVASLTVKNTGSEEIEMYDTDFTVLWDDSSDDAYSAPVTRNLPGGQTLGQDMFPATYTLKAKESLSGVLVYEVPANYQSFSIAYFTVFGDDTTGDLFYVDFTAEKQ